MGQSGVRHEILNNLPRSGIHSQCPENVIALIYFPDKPPVTLLHPEPVQMLHMVDMGTLRLSALFCGETYEGRGEILFPFLLLGP